MFVKSELFHLHEKTEDQETIHGRIHTKETCKIIRLIESITEPILLHHIKIVTLG